MKVILLAVVLWFSTISAYASFDENTNSQEQKAYGGDADAKAYSDSDSKAYSNQEQGQVGIQKAVGQGNTTTINENDKTEVNAPTWPSTPSTYGKDEKSVYSLFGGIGSNRTEEHIRLTEQLKVLDIMLKKGILDVDAYTEEIARVYSQLTKANNPPKLLGIIPEGFPILGSAGRGCSIINLCGLASW